MVLSIGVMLDAVQQDISSLVAYTEVLAPRIELCRGDSAEGSGRGRPIGVRGPARKVILQVVNEALVVDYILAFSPRSRAE